MRVHQWAKNVLLFIVAGLNLKSLNVLDGTALLVSFFMFNLIASGTYLINDLLDIQSDRLHPKKKNRPIARGDLSTSSWLIISFLLLGLPLCLGGLFVGQVFILYSTVYIAMTLFYSLALKEVEIIDVLCLGGLFSLRVLMGAAIANKYVSIWFMAFILLFFLSLAIGKRVIEIKKNEALGKLDKIPGRGYSVADLPFMTNFGVTTGLLAFVTVLNFYLLNRFVFK